ncbi:MAG TPA: ATP-binding protein [Polyangiaceae bacterium]
MEPRIVHLQRVQSVAMAITKELLRTRTDREVFDAACRIAVEHGHFRFAWVGLIEPGGGHARVAAWAGFEDGYVRILESGVQESSDNRSVIARFLANGEPLVINNVDGGGEPASFGSRRPEAIQRGYRSAASMPLRRGGQVIGWLAIYAEEACRFDRPQLDLLHTLADDISFKLDVIDADARRHAAEDALRRSEERFRAFFDLASDAIFIADAEDRIVSVNPAACAMTGFSSEELRGQQLAALRDRHAMDSADRARFGRSPGEDRMRRKDGSALDVEVGATLLADGGVQAFVRDVEVRKHVQEQLIFADRLASLGRLAAGVAHEVNNPLTYLLLNLERLEKGLARPCTPQLVADLRTSAAMARDGAERVRAIVRALGAFGRQDDALVGGIDLHHVVDAALRLSESQARNSGRIVKDYRATRQVRASELRLTQVFVNLLSNAADALRGGAVDRNTIEIRTYDDESDGVVAEVRDNGSGIPPHLLGRIFDPFFTTKPVGEGTGLGLSICHSIVRSFGGSIGVTSKPGEGSTFRVTLPEHDAAPAGRARTPAPAATGEAIRGVRVLAVDDEPHILEMIAAILPECRITTARSGGEALEHCRTSDYDCVVCDLIMPGLGGAELHEEIGRLGGPLAERMVFITGGAFTDRTRRFVEQTRQPVLEKPFTSEQLLAAIRGVLD